MTTPKWLQRVPPEEAARMVRALCRNQHNVDERDLLLDLLRARHEVPKPRRVRVHGPIPGRDRCRPTHQVGGTRTGG